MTKTRLFQTIQDLDGNGLVTTDDDLLVRTIDAMDNMDDGEEWEAIKKENLEEEEE